MAQVSPLEACARPAVIVVDASLVYVHSPVTGSAAWVAEFMTREMLAAESAPRGGSFYAERSVPAELRATLRDYEGGAWDRGHLAPDGDAASAQAKILRMSLANVVPQSPGLNRGLWRRLEEHVRDLAREQGAVFVVTAPSYVKQGRPIVVGNLVAPTHLVKCVLVYGIDDANLSGFPTGRDPHSMQAWIIPNQPPPAAATLDTYRRTVDACEELLQLDLFPWVDDETENRMEAAR